MQRITRLTLVLCGTAVLAGCSSSLETVEYHGDYPQYANVADLCGEAEIVALVTPLREEVREVNVAGPAGDTEAENPSLGANDLSRDERPAPVLVVQTVTTVRVDAVFKGHVRAGSELEVGQLGGRLGDVLYEAQAFDFAQAPQSLVFLDVWPNDVPASPLNPTQASYGVSDGHVTPQSAVAGVSDIARAPLSAQLCTTLDG